MIYDEDPKLYSSLFRSKLRMPSWEEKMQLDHSIDKAWNNTLGVFDPDDNVSSEGEIDGAHMSPERTYNLPLETTSPTDFLKAILSPTSSAGKKRSIQKSPHFSINLNSTPRTASLTIK